MLTAICAPLLVNAVDKGVLAAFLSIKKSENPGSYQACTEVPPVLAVRVRSVETDAIESVVRQAAPAAALAAETRSFSANSWKATA